MSAHQLPEFVLELDIITDLLTDYAFGCDDVFDVELNQPKLYTDVSAAS